MNEHDVMYQVRESFSGLRMDTPVEQVWARSRARRRHKLAALTAATAATAGAAAVIALTAGGAAPAPARSGRAPSASPGSASQGSVRLAAFTVTNGPGDSTTLVLRKDAPLDPSALRQALAQHGIPALVTVGSFCRTTPLAPVPFGQVVQPTTLADGSDAIVINGQAMPPGAELSIGTFQQTVRMSLIEQGAPLSCFSTPGQPGQPVIHITGTPNQG
ncbi:MAG: hypothetical protein ACRDOU_10320 [Streptosporangiaceae bacterium]